MRPIAVAVGHVTLDAYPAGPRPGGSVLYAAKAWRALGAEARVLTACGPDYPAGSRAELGAEAQEGAVTTRFLNRYDAEGGRVQRLHARAAPVLPDRLPAAWRRPDLAFLCPVLGEVPAGPWLAALAGAARVGVGLQGWLKRADADGLVVHGPDGVDPRQFAGAGAAFLSEEDLAGRLGWLDALRAVVPLIFLTRGRRGCLIFEGERRAMVGVVPTEEVDPTGAGDTFAAAALLALAEGADAMTAARHGAAAASVVVEYEAEAPLEALREAPTRLDRVA